MLSGKGMVRQITHCFYFSSISLLNFSYFSAVSCTEVDPGLNITVDSTLLPAENGTELPFHCLKKHAKQDTTVRAECQSGMIIFTPGGTSSCTKIGMVHVFLKSLRYLVEGCSCIVYDIVCKDCFLTLGCVLSNSCGHQIGRCINV